MLSEHLYNSENSTMRIVLQWKHSSNICLLQNRWQVDWKMSDKVKSEPPWKASPSWLVSNSCTFIAQLVRALDYYCQGHSCKSCSQLQILWNPEIYLPTLVLYLVLKLCFLLKNCFIHSANNYSVQYDAIDCT